MVNKVRTNYGKFNVHFSVLFVWNNLDANFKSSSLYLFKQTMKEKLIFYPHTFESG